MSDPYTPLLLSLPGSVTPTLAIQVLPHGLTIHKVIVQVNGKVRTRRKSGPLPVWSASTITSQIHSQRQTHDIVIGPEDPKDHSTIKYMNTIIGRYANRVPVGKHVVEKNGITTSFEALANESPKVSLHGGPEGFDRRIWQKFTRLDDVKLFTKAEIQSIAARTDASAVVFSLTSPDGDQGYSGTLYLETLVVLVPPVKLDPSTVSQHELGSIVIVYRAKLVDLPEGQKQVTPINLTQHWGFNLDVSMQDGEETLGVLNHDLTIKASHIAELQPNSLPAGRCIPIAEADNSSGAHIHDTKRIGDIFPGAGYDDYYLLSPRSDLKLVSPHRIPISEFSDSLDLVKDVLTVRNDPVLRLSSDKSGLAVEFDSNQAGLMFYTNNYTDAKGYRKKIHGGTGLHGDGYIPQSAAFFEFHEPLSAFLYPTSTSTDTLLTSDEIYNNYVRVDIVSRPSETRE
ncbi:galactose mutarotase-like domain-containing protein [Boletus edulis]|nr:galactose mutarotase-like domain-containing protein [Boletus edulis]